MIPVPQPHAFPDCSSSRSLDDCAEMVQSDKIPEGDHSLNTVQKKGAAVSQSSGGKIPSVNGPEMDLL